MQYQLLQRWEILLYYLVMEAMGRKKKEKKKEKSVYYISSTHLQITGTIFPNTYSSLIK